jgi:hypothetical protein
MLTHLIHPLFQRGLKARQALFEKEGGWLRSRQTGDLIKIKQDNYEY